MNNTSKITVTLIDFNYTDSVASDTVVRASSTPTTVKVFDGATHTETNDNYLVVSGPGNDKHYFRLDSVLAFSYTEPK